jgi:hypothetical protein
MSLILLANPARLSGVQPCSCMTKSDHGGVHVQCGRPHQQLCFHRRPAWPGHGFAFLRWEHWRQPCSSLNPHKKVERESEPPNRITFYSAACLGSGFSAQLEQSSLYRSLSCSKQGSLIPCSALTHRKELPGGRIHALTLHIHGRSSTSS